MTMTRENQYLPADSSAGEGEKSGAPVSQDTMDRFLKTYERSAKRWEIVVFPAMFAFVILAGYGFFLIYSLTMDVRQMAKSVDPHMGQHMVVMAEGMMKMSDNMTVMTGQVQSMAANMDHVSGKMNSMDNLDQMAPMLVELRQMNGSMRAMTANMDMMRHDISTLNNNVSRPMSIMNGLMPW